MPEPWQQQERSVTPQQVVGVAVQKLAAARLGRGFVPLAILLPAGVAQMLRDGYATPSAMILVVGAPLVALAMLAYALRIVQRAFGRPARAWMSLAMVGSLLPPTFAVYVFAWPGLRMLFGGGGLSGFASAVLFTVLGAWVLRSWMKVVQVERLARVMSMNLDDGEGL